MTLVFKKIIFSLIFNSCLFLLLIIGIQNSSKKTKLNLSVNETVELPISFIVGSSFVGGSIFGSLLNIDLNRKNK